MSNKTVKSVVELVIDGQRSRVNLKELGTALRATRKEFRELREEENPQLYKQKLTELQKLNQEYRQTKLRINDIQQESKQLNSVWKEVFKGFTAANLASTALNLAGQGVDAFKRKVYDLSDQLADVAKTTNQSIKEVAALNSELQKLDSRTSMDDLRGIAEIGGRWDVQAKDMASFVESTDKLNIAFGDQFDSVESLTDETLKLRNIFRDIKSDNIGDDILHIGNAMNVLEASGAATGKGLADFGSRIGGVAIPLGLSTAQVLGLSASLEELSVTPERGATAVNRILQKMLTDVNTFANVAGMEVGAFKKMLNTDLFGAFLIVAEGSQKSGASATAFAEILKDTHLQGAGASEVLMKLATNQDLVNGKVNLATEALTNTNSVMDEFNKKNNNAAAVQDKIAKKFDIALEKVAMFGIAALEAYGNWSGIIDPVQTQLEKLNEEQEKLGNYESKLLPLLDRYEELRSKTGKSVEEQDELKRLLKEITDIMPEAAIAFDKHGDAIDVDAQKTRDLIRDQRTLLETLRQTRREMLGDRINRRQVAVDDIQKELNRGTKVENVHLGMGQYQRQERKLTSDEIRQRQRDLAKLQSELHQDQTDRKRLIGDFDADPVKESNKGSGKGNKNSLGGGGGVSESGSDKTDKAKGLADQLKKIQQQLVADQLSGAEKEIQIAKYKYDQLRDMAKGNAEQMARINQFEKDEILLINDKYAKKEAETFDKSIRSQLEAQMKKGLEKTKMEQDIANKVDQTQQGEIAKINATYTEMLLKAEQHGIDTTNIYTIWSAALHALKQKQIAKDTALVLEGYEQETKAGKKTIVDANDTYQIKLSEARANGDSEQRIHRDRLREIEQMQAENAGRDLEQTKALAAQKRQVQKQLLDSMVRDNEMYGAMLSGATDIIGNLMQLAADNQEEAAEYQKKMALAQLAIQTGVAIANGIAAATTTSNPFAIAAAMIAMTASITANMVKAKEMIAKAEPPAAPAYREDGGWTDLASINKSKDPAGWVSSPTLFELGQRSFVAGEKYKKEYVISSDMLKDPVINATARQMEYYRTSGARPAAGSASAAGSGGGGDMSALVGMMADLISETRATRQALEDGKVGVRFNYREFDEGKKYLEYIYKEVSL